MHTCTFSPHHSSRICTSLQTRGEREAERERERKTKRDAPAPHHHNYLLLGLSKNLPVRPFIGCSRRGSAATFYGRPTRTWPCPIDIGMRLGIPVPASHNEHIDQFSRDQINSIPIKQTEPFSDTSFIFFFNAACFQWTYIR